MSNPFDTTSVGHAFKRINRIEIIYPAPMTARVTFTEQEFVLLDDGSFRPVSAENVVSFDVSPSNMADMIPLSDINTGEELGVSMSYGQIMLGIVAAIRMHQK